MGRGSTVETRLSNCNASLTRSNFNHKQVSKLCSISTPFNIQLVNHKGNLMCTVRIKP